MIQFVSPLLIMDERWKSKVLMGGGEEWEMMGSVGGRG